MNGNKWWVLCLLGLLLASCQIGEPAPLVVETTGEPTPTLAPTPLPAETAVTPTSTPAQKILTICQATEPDSLYQYSPRSLAQTHIHHALYQPLYTKRGYTYQPVGLVERPRLNNQTARLEAITVAAGDMVVDVSGIVVPLDVGVTLFNTSGQPVTYEGSPIAAGQMVVEFELTPLVWSDGQPLTAADSVYSFNIARAPASVVTDEERMRLGRTAVYEATGEHTLRWVGLPGWRDSHYFLNVWPPLPAHRLDIYTPSQLSQIEETTRRPLASGPFMVEEWVAGSHIDLSPNPHYYQASSVQLDGLTIRFLPNPNQAVSELLAGRCHIITHDGVDPQQTPFFQEAAAEGLLLPHYQTSMDYELLAFGLQPFATEGADTATRWLADEQVRQAIAMCINRERLVAELWGGRTAVMLAYLHPNHPLIPDDLAQWVYDPSTANNLLDELGYLDQDGDGVRQNEVGEPLILQLFSSQDEWQQTDTNHITANLIAENLAACGLVITPTYLSDGELFEPNPASPLAGRRFDLALLSRVTAIDPPCGEWQTSAIPGPVTAGFGGWSAPNITGWSDSEFDTACQAAQQAFWDSEAYQLQHQTALRRFVEGVPALPLYSNLKIALTSPDVVGLILDPTQPSELWNVARFDLRE